MAKVDVVFSDKTGTLTRNELEYIDFVGNCTLAEDAIAFQLALCNTLFIRNNSIAGESQDEITLAEHVSDYVRIVARTKDRITVQYTPRDFDE